MLDAGNLFFGKTHLENFERAQHLAKASVIVESYNTIGVDAIALGPLDFAAGMEPLRRLQEKAAFPFLCANLIDQTTKKPIFTPYAIFNRGTTRVGVVGLMDSSRPLPDLGAHADGLRINPEYDCLKLWARRLREEMGCDVVVALSSASRNRFRLPAKQLPEVALYITGDPRDSMSPPGHFGAAVITGTGHLGKYLGLCALAADQPGDPIRFVDNDFIPMKPDYPDDPEVQALVDGYFDGLTLAGRGDTDGSPEEEAKTHGLLGEAVYVGDQRCRSCHPEHHADWAATPHARALSDLPEVDRLRYECLECHVTGFGRQGGFAGDTASSPLGGVQCEGCHGPGSLHPASDSIARGSQLDEVCRNCHTQSRSPNFQLSDYRKRLSCVARNKHI